MLAMAISLIAACGDSEKSILPTVNMVNITTKKVNLKDIQITEHAVGEILNPRSMTVSAEVSAKVAWVGVNAGSFIRKNEVLVRLDSHDFKAQEAAAEAEIASLEARIPVQKRLLERYRKLAADKFISPTMLDQTEAELSTLIQSKRVAVAKLVRVRLNLAHTTVHAPISGQVQQRFVAPGDYVQTGAKLIDIVADGLLTIRLPFPETKAGVIRVGQQVLLHLPVDGHVVHAVIHDLSPMIGRESGAFEARLKVKNPDGWRPGGSVLADVQVGEHQHAMIVPEASIVLRPQGEVVYVIANDKAFERPVQSGVHIGDGVEVVRGLKADEMIAVDGASFLTDGAAVHVIDTEEEASEKEVEDD